MQKQTGTACRVSVVADSVSSTLRARRPKSSILPVFQSPILLVLLAAGMMLAMAQRASADWTGSGTGSQTYDNIANWNSGAGPINDVFNGVVNSGLVLNFNNDRTTAGTITLKFTANQTVTLQAASTKTITLNGNIDLAVGGGNGAPISFGSSLIVDLNGSARVFYTPNQRAV